MGVPLSSTSTTLPAMSNCPRELEHTFGDFRGRPIKAKVALDYHDRQMRMNTEFVVKVATLTD
jgi:hypothetical protein